MWVRVPPLAPWLLAVIGACGDDPQSARRALALTPIPCDDVADWPTAWAADEDAVRGLVNERRAAGADCGSGGLFLPTSALALATELRCSARRHARDMDERGFFDHLNPDGLDPFDRMHLASYDFTYAGENLAVGYPTPAAVVEGWLASPGHCTNIMDPNYAELGVGLVRGAGEPLWVQNFGAR